MSSPRDPAEVCRFLIVAILRELERLEAQLDCMLRLPSVDLDALRALESRIDATMQRLRSLMHDGSGMDSSGPPPA